MSNRPMSPGVPSLDKDTVDEFIRELSALSKKYRIQIAGCGCCDSPYLLPIQDDDLPGSYNITIDDTTYKNTIYGNVAFYKRGEHDG